MRVGLCVSSPVMDRKGWPLGVRRRLPLIGMRKTRTLAKATLARSFARLRTDATSEVTRPGLWAGKDTDKAQHQCTATDADSTCRPFRLVVNDKTVLLRLIAETLQVNEGAPVTWAIGLDVGGPR